MEGDAVTVVEFCRRISSASPMFDNEYHIKLGRSEYFAMRESRLPNPRVLFLQAFAITRRRRRSVIEASGNE